MWPDAFPAWFEKWASDAERAVRDRLIHYPVLKVFANRTAALGVARTREIASYLCQYPRYFLKQAEFSRWLRTIGYREALRLVLQPEPMEVVLEVLGDSARRLLQWKYVDQLTDDDTARLLDLRTDNRLLFDAAAARKLSINTYLQLCRTLELRSPSDAQGPRTVGRTSVFPLFPGLCPLCSQPTSKGGLG